MPTASKRVVTAKSLSTLLAGALLLGAIPVRPQGTPPKDPATLAAHDSHQGLLIAADPLLKADDYKSRFGKKTPYASGLIAIDVYFRNDTGTPVQLNLETIRLTVTPPGEQQQDLPALNARDVTALTLGGGQDPTTARKKLPLPGMGGGRGKEWDELQGKVRSASLASDIIPPHATVHGLLYFDLDGHFEWLKSSRLYVPDLQQMGTGKALLFFEVPLSAGS